MDKVSLLSVPFDPLTNTAVLARLSDCLAEDTNRLVVTPNPECLMRARRDAAFLRILQTADFVLADGIGILMAAKWLGLPIPERVRGVDTARALLSIAAKRNASVYLLGAAPGVAEEARRRINQQWTHKTGRAGPVVVGAQNGYFESDEAIIEEIIRLRPDILIIGMGMPRQEKWAAAHLDALPCKITLCAGGTIDIFAGRVKLAPAWMRKIGMEWLYRLCSQPSRAKRMLVLPHFLGLVFRERFR